MAMDNQVTKLSKPKQCQTWGPKYSTCTDEELWWGYGESTIMYNTITEDTWKTDLHNFVYFMKTQSLQWNGAEKII